MNIVVLHRIPFAKIRYDLAVDHREHVVRYLAPAGAYDDLPAGSERRLLDATTGDPRTLASQHADWLGEADRLIARSEYDLLPAAQLRQEFRIPGDAPAAVLPVRDKWLMRTLAAEAGIAQPSFWSVEDFLRDAPESGRFLIKPRLEASSTGIRLGDVTQILDALRDGSDPHDVFVEEFVPGEIWHLDGYLRDATIGAVVSSVYVGDCLSYAHGTPLGSAQTSDEPEALALLRATLAALGQRDGCFHFELIRTADGRYLFLETASRVGGAGVAETFELRTGVNLYQADLQVQLGGTIGDIPQKESQRPSRDFYGWFVFPAHHRTRHAPLDFDPARYEGRLVSFVHNALPAARAGQISYAAAATPLSGVVRGTDPDDVRRTLQDILTATTAREQA